MTRVPVKVVIDDKHLDEQDAVQQAASAAGMKIEECIPEIGTFFGSAEPNAVRRIGQISGVLRARQEAVYRLPPRTGPQ